MLRLISNLLVLAALLGVSARSTNIHNASVRTTPTQVTADGTDPTAPPFPLAPQVADGTDPTAPPFPLGPQVADGTDPTAPPFPLGPQVADGTDPTAFPLAA
jgi:hypothetical protein